MKIQLNLKWYDRYIGEYIKVNCHCIIHYLYFTFFIFLLLDSIQSNGQCTINAGRDTAICGNFGKDTLLLGGSPTVLSGIPPYKYTWSCTYKTAIETYNASYFLNNISISNPKLKNSAINPVVFYLKTIDGLGNICLDSVRVTFSNWIWTYDDKIEYISKGDSVKLYTSIFGGISPITYLWSPSKGLTNPNKLNTWAKPDTTTKYTLIAIDAIGCRCPKDDYFKVNVKPAGINFQTEQIKPIIFPNPLTEISIIYILKNNFLSSKIIFYNIYGIPVKQMILQNRSTEIIRNDFETGIYFYKLIYLDSQLFGHGKLIVK